MIITIRDGLGYVSLEIENDITFTDGYAFFTADNKEYKVHAEHVVEITVK